jgi:hypothetical protein
LSYAQVGINTNTPDASSALEIESTTGGILIPRMTETQRDAIALPASGLMIYQTDEISGFYFYNGTQWTSVGMSGPQGDQGPQGEAGPAGAAGAPGPIGPTGPAGADGADGAQGPVGPAGAQGLAGADGADGTDGAQGLTGAQGPAGADGADGIQGPTGPIGPAGAQGPTGLAGADGADGDQGPIGPAGADGTNGTNGSSAYEIWTAAGNTGETIVFTKTNYADWTLEENQDRITNNIWITRKNNRSIFNIAAESESPNGCSSTAPAGTQWAIGSTAQGVENLTFGTFYEAHDCEPESILNVDMVIWLIAENIYIDIKFLSWTSGGDGGGFSYMRSVPGGSGTGTEAEFLASLVGADGEVGPQGPAGADGADGIQGPVGPVGPQGDQGLQGLAGADGADGAQGPIGNTGPAGPQGAQGIQGATGATGPQGLAGADGADGAQGPIGPAGAQGPTGLAGADGADGDQGPQGDQGIQGATGATGPQGPAGADGADGAQGPVGPTGPIGPAGAQGPTGLAGADGADGAQGPQGDQGIQGATGATGPQGLAGVDGADGNDGNGIASTVDNNDGTFTLTFDDNTTFTTSDLTGPEGPLVSGTNGQTLYNNGTEWVSTSNLYNDGTSIAIGTDDIDSSSVLQIESTTQGVLFPKMTSEQRDLIATPQTGLLIFQIDNSPGFYFYDGTAWVALDTSNGTSSGGSDSKTLIYTTNGF